MAHITNEEHLAEVLSRFDDSPNPRLAEITTAAIRHLHAFVAEVGLTREEWFAGIQALTTTGQMCSDERQEFILLSDTLGVSMLVEMIRLASGVDDAAIDGDALPVHPVRGWRREIHH